MMSKFGFETVITIGAFLGNDLPAELKNAESLKIWKKNLGSTHHCPCKICQKFKKKKEIGINTASKSKTKQKN